jgi:hypothetical protein
MWPIVRDDLEQDLLGDCRFMLDCPVHCLLGQCLAGAEYLTAVLHCAADALCKLCAGRAAMTMQY